MDDDEKWQVTADDYVYAFQRIFDPQTQSPYTSMFSCLQNADAVQSGQLTPEEIGVAIMAEIIEVKNQNKRVCGYPEDLLEAILDIVHPGKKMLATIITRKGSAPRNVGSKMLILEDGSCVGTIGGGCMEAEVLRKARVMMHENNTGLKTEYVDMKAWSAAVRSRCYWNHSGIKKGWKRL